MRGLFLAMACGCAWGCCVSRCCSGAAMWAIIMTGAVAIGAAIASLSERKSC